MIALLHNIRSLHNVGSIFRTADAVGLEKIYLCGITPSPIDEFGQFRPQISKVSLGAEKTVSWDDSARSPQAIAKLIEKLKKDGYKIFALEISKNSTPYNLLKSHFNISKVVLIVGNEVRGLPKSILNEADKILSIPMRGKKESLNVAVAFGVVAYHLSL